MSDFKIIKCKKCDAGLVELEGETLGHCVQCGYNFGVVKTSNISTDSIPDIKQAIEQTPGSLSDIIKRVQQKIAEQNNKKPTAKSKVSLKKKSWIFTMIKWYFIIALFLGILTGIFSE